MDVIGCDVGGTFTDLLAFDPEAVRLSVRKVPTTPSDPSVGVLRGIEALGIDPAGIDRFLHGTTVTTNAVLERAGAPCGLIATEGFRDVLELGWRDRPSLWGLSGTYEPLVPRDRAVGVPERTTADGEVLRPVDEAAVRAAGERLLDAGAEAVAVVFLHAYANPANEERAAAALREVWPTDHVVRSSAVLPEYREFERASTTALSAYTRPVIADYLDRLATRLGEAGYERDVVLVQSNGGMAAADVSARRPAHTVLSGPAAGATAAAAVARAAGFEHVISCDVGGTSFDVALLPDGEPAMTQKTTLGYQVPVRVPMVDVTTIGAGGGSIARIDDGGLLHVGPESAGADPGPVCYGRGGTAVTVTDANLVLGRIDPDSPIGHGPALDVEGAEAAIRADVAEPLGLSVPEAAAAVIEVGVRGMVGGIRELSVGRGHDPRDFTLVAFGGAGPLHAAALLDRGDVPRAVIPRYPGVLSALGCVVADVRHDHVRSVNEPIDGIDPESFAEAVAGLEGAGRELLDAEAVDFDAVRVDVRSDMKYRGQAHAVTVPLPSTAPSREDLRSAFRGTYLETYRELVDTPVVVDNVRVTVTGVVDPIDLARFAEDPGGAASDAVTDQRPVAFDGDWYDAAIYDRGRLPHGATVAGPAIVEQPDATTAVPPGMAATVDPVGNLVLGVDG